MSTFQAKITKHGKKEKTVTCTQKKKQRKSIETDSNWAQMLAPLDFQLAIIKWSQNFFKNGLNE